MKKKELYDPIRHAVISIDPKGLLIGYQVDGYTQEIRLSPMHTALMLALFEGHPDPIPYQALMKIVKHYKLACPDVMRLHRKMSELRQTLEDFLPVLGEALQNIRGVGYSLPLIWRVHEENEIEVPVTMGVASVLKGIEDLVKQSAKLVTNAVIVSHDDYFMQDRAPVLAELNNMVSRFNDLEKILMVKFQSSKADFNVIRLQEQLSLLRTYIGLCRMCDEQMTPTEWARWHKQEIEQVYESVCAWVKDSSENLKGHPDHRHLGLEAQS